MCKKLGKTMPRSVGYSTLALLLAMGVGCSNDSGGSTGSGVGGSKPGSGGAPARGGSQGNGGSVSSGGSLGSGGSPGSGGVGGGKGSGGSLASGGVSESGGVAGTGGVAPGGGGAGRDAAASSGGSSGSGGAAGGSSGSGGIGGTAGTTGAGGGGAAATGGRTATGGTTGGGGTPDASADAAEPTKPLATLQSDYIALKFGMFLHFNMGTFTGEEWASPNQSANKFNPTALNTDQWASTAVAGGVKYVVLTTKHHDGFSIWPSAYTKYTVAASTWKNGQGDVVRAFVDSMRAQGLKVGFYFSVWDKSNGDSNGVPTVQFVENQLKELLTNYGPITIIWFDGWGWAGTALGRGVPFSSIPYQTLHDYVKSVSPNTLVLVNNHEHNLTHSDIVEYERALDSIPSTSNTTPAEVCDTIQSNGNWFYHSGGSCGLTSQSSLQSSLKSVEAGHANYLLDLSPDTTGAIPSCQAQLMGQLKP
jgi:hypothetical protein